MALDLDQPEVSSDSSLAFSAGMLEERCCALLHDALLHAAREEAVFLSVLRRSTWSPGHIYVCQVLHCGVAIVPL